MTSNPYASPLARVEDLPDDPATGEPRRPLSVWTFQVVATLVACAFALVTLLSAIAALEEHTLRDDFVEVGLIVGMAIVLGLGATIVGCQRRARFARWAGLACIAAVVGLLVEGFLRASMPFVQNADIAVARRLAVVAVILLLTVPLAFWFWAFGFSAKSRAWFGVFPKRST